MTANKIVQEEREPFKYIEDCDFEEVDDLKGLIDGKEEYDVLWKDTLESIKMMRCLTYRSMNENVQKVSHYQLIKSD